MNEYKTYKHYLAQCLKKSTEAADQTEFLVTNHKIELAIDRIYFQCYYALSAYAYKNGFEAQNDNLLYDWYFQEAKELHTDEIQHQFVKEIHTLYQKAHFDFSFDHKTISIPKLTKEANQLLLKVKKYLDTPENLPHMLVASLFTLYNSNALTELSEELKPIASTFLHDVKTKVCTPNPNALRIYNEILANTANPQLYAQLEEHLLEIVDKNKQAYDTMEEVCFKIGTLKLDSFELNTKQEEIEDVPLPEITDKEKQTIIIPWDFTKVAHWALEHAVNFASVTNAEIHLVHIVKKLKEAGDAEQKLKANKTENEAKYKVKIITAIREGTIFHAITDYATEVHAKLVIMGTHGAQGMQKFTGSWAIKVIAKTKVPFIVVQAPPARKEIRNVVFPVDYRREIKQKVNEAYYLSQYYNLKFFITKPEKIQVDTLRQKTLNNTYFMRSFFAQYGIEHEVIEVKNAKDYSDATLKFAAQSTPDLIIIVLNKEMGFQDFMFGAEEEKIIMNDLKVPVMCINPPPAKSWSYRSGTS